MRKRLGAVLEVFEAALRNSALRRVGFAYSLFSLAEYGVWLALLVFAYAHGGAAAAMVMVLGQLVPSAVLGPVIGALADRARPGRFLLLSYGLQTVSISLVALAAASRGPTLVVFLLAPLTSLSISMTRPAQAALLPSVVMTADELTAANVMTGWTEGGASLAGPALVGGLIAWHGVGLAIVAMAAVTCGGSLLVASALRPKVAGQSLRLIAGRSDGGRATAGEWRADMAGTVLALRAGLSSNLAATLHNSATRTLLVLRLFYYALIGSLDLLCVILAVSILHIGAGGAGYLNAALGGGALLAGLVTAFLVGRQRLSNTLILGILGAVAALCLLGLFPSSLGAFLLIGAVGLSGAVFDITGRTLWQRAAPFDAIAGSSARSRSLPPFHLQHSKE